MIQENLCKSDKCHEKEGNPMKDKTILVTGSTDGIGKQTALELAKMGAHILLHGRNPEKGRLVINDIRNRTGNSHLELLIADLSSQKQIYSLADSIINNYDELHVLINNAATYIEERRLTEDGIETTFAVNHLGPFLLTNLLLDLLKKSAPARIITVSSEVHSWIKTIDLFDLQGERRYNGLKAYAISKLGNILFTYELAERLNGTEVTANCLHPGKIITNLSRAAGLDESLGDCVEIGAITSIYLASSHSVERLNGLYFVNLQPMISSELSLDHYLQEKFWNISENLVGNMKY